MLTPVLGRGGPFPRSLGLLSSGSEVTGQLKQRIESLSYVRVLRKQEKLAKETV